MTQTKIERFFKSLNNEKKEDAKGNDPTPPENEPEVPVNNFVRRPGNSKRKKNVPK